MASSHSDRQLIRRTALAALLVAASATAARAQATSRPDNYYGAGNRVEITTPMAADVVVAGKEVEIRQSVAGDVLAAGWNVVMTGRADDDVRLAGGQVRVNAPVRGDLTVAGGDVTIGADTQVTGRSWITGRTVRIDGTFDRELEVAGASVQIGGETRKPLRVVAEHLELLPGARVLAPLTYKGTTEMHVASGAIVNGPVTYEKIAEAEARRARSFPTASSAIFTIHLFIAGVLVLLFAPRAEQSVVDTLRRHPAKSVLLGFVLLVTTPIAALLLVVSVFGLPLGLALAAAYGIAIFCGLLATAFCIGDLEARWFSFDKGLTRSQQALMLLAGVLTLAVLRSTLGGVVVFASVLFGLGALTLRVYEAYGRASAATPASA